MTKISAGRMMWNIYAMDMGHDDANTWTDGAMQEWAQAEIDAGNDIGNMDGITQDMIRWSGWLDSMNDDLDVYDEPTTDDDGFEYDADWMDTF